MKLTLLGTSCMVPTKTRNVSGMYLDFQGTGVLFDCGEGTQRQMNLAGLNRNNISIICISHWHADHVAGLTGLLQTLDAKGGEKKLTIIGPVETKVRLQHLIDATYCNLELELDVIEVGETATLDVALDSKDFIIQAISLKHGIPCVGYTFVQKERYRVEMERIKAQGVPAGRHLAKLQSGVDSEYNGKILTVSEFATLIPQKKFAYIADTGLCETAYILAQNADLLVCESTYLAEQESNAKKYNHLTCVQAAQIAKECAVKKLILTHISQRYSKVDVLLAQAQYVFKNVIVGEDFLSEKF